MSLDSEQERLLQLAWAAGALEAVRHLGLLSLDESVEWHARFVQALGLDAGAEPKGPTPVGPAPSREVPAADQLRAVVVAGCAQFGDLAITTLELYGGFFVVRWIADGTPEVLNIIKAPFAIEDDVGTRYESVGSSARYRAGAMPAGGESRFSPAPPPEADWLTLSLGGDELELALTNDRRRHDL